MATWIERMKTPSRWRVSWREISGGSAELHRGPWRRSLSMAKQDQGEIDQRRDHGQQH